MGAGPINRADRAVMEWAALWLRLAPTPPGSFFSKGPSCFTWILLYDTNSLRRRRPS